MELAQYDDSATFLTQSGWLKREIRALANAKDTANKAKVETKLVDSQTLGRRWALSS